MYVFIISTFELFNKSYKKSYINLTNILNNFKRLVHKKCYNNIEITLKQFIWEKNICIKVTKLNYLLPFFKFKFARTIFLHLCTLTVLKGNKQETKSVCVHWDFLEHHGLHDSHEIIWFPMWSCKVQASRRKVWIWDIVAWLWSSQIFDRLFSPQG